MHFNDSVIDFANHRVELLVYKSEVVFSCRNVNIQITPANVIDTFDQVTNWGERIFNNQVLDNQEQQKECNQNDDTVLSSDFSPAGTAVASASTAK